MVFDLKLDLADGTRKTGEHIAKSLEEIAAGIRSHFRNKTASADGLAPKLVILPDIEAFASRVASGLDYTLTAAQVEAVRREISDALQRMHG